MSEDAGAMYSLTTNYTGAPFFTLKQDAWDRIYVAMYRGNYPYCRGSRSIVLTKQSKVGAKIACPVCGRLAGISPKYNKLQAHYRPNELAADQ